MREVGVSTGKSGGEASQNMIIPAQGYLDEEVGNQILMELVKINNRLDRIERYLQPNVSEKEIDYFNES